MDSADKFEVEKLISLAPGFSQVVTMSLTRKPFQRLTMKTVETVIVS